MSNFSNTNNSNGALVKNSRFECLNDDNDTTNTTKNMNYQYSSNRYSRRDERRREQSRYRNSMLSGRYSFLAEKKEPKKKNQVNLKTERFPSLINLKKSCTRETVMGNYKEKALYTEEEIQKKKREKQQQRERESLHGWVTISRKNGITEMCNIDKQGRKVPVDPEEDYVKEKPYDHKQFQKDCAVVMYRNLQIIQAFRDEENEILGPHSRYYNKGSLTDLSYLSDDDVESTDEEDENKNENDYDSDNDTY